MRMGFVESSPPMTFAFSNMNQSDLHRVPWQQHTPPRRPLKTWRGEKMEKVKWEAILLGGTFRVVPLSLAFAGVRFAFACVCHVRDGEEEKRSVRGRGSKRGLAQRGVPGVPRHACRGVNPCPCARISDHPGDHPDASDRWLLSLSLFPTTAASRFCLAPCISMALLRPEDRFSLPLSKSLCRQSTFLLLFATMKR